MKTLINNYQFKLVMAIYVFATLSALCRADEKQESSRERIVKERRLSTISKSQSAAEGFESVEMFSAMSSGDVEVVFKATDAAHANLVVKNNSDRPLAIQMPAAFSAVPVMRQGIAGGGGIGGGGLGGGQQGGGGGGFGGGGQQGTGGGIGGGQGGGGIGGGQGGGGQGGGGVFNIPPGRSGRLQVNTVCLEEGKPEPKSRIEYVIQPLENLNSDPRIFELCRMLANDEISQQVGQAAAWNITDGLSWQEMLVKNRIERMDGSYERYFHPDHIQLAQQVVVAAAQRAEARAKANREYEQSVSNRDGNYGDSDN